MSEPRIIKESVRKAIKDAVFSNKQRRQHTSTSQWMNERYTYLIDALGGLVFTVEVMGARVVTDLATLPEECYDAVLSRSEVYSAINKERDHQDNKWGINKPQSLPGFLVVLEKELQEAKDAWVKNVEGEHAALNEIVQIAATAVACLEKYGVTGSAIATNDIPNNQR